MDLSLFYPALFAASIALGLALERLRVPWIFAALLIGLALAGANPFAETTDGPAFTFLATLGLHLFLVLIGLMVDVDELWKSRGFLIRVATVVTLIEAVAGSIFLHYVFGTSWPIAFVVALSFATVGEAFLLPILEELRILRTRLGQTILGVGVIDNVFEVLAVVGVSLALAFAGGGSETSALDVVVAFAGIALILVAGFAARVQRVVGRLLASSRMGDALAVAVVLGVAFLAIWIGERAGAAALGALAAGLAAQRLIPEGLRERAIERVKAMVYALFGPILFAWVGLEVDLAMLATAPLTILALMLLVKAGKIGGSWISARWELGDRRAVFMGVALAVKFSTSIVLVKLLHERGLIGRDVYSVLIAAKIGFKFVVPFLLAWLATRWALGEGDERETAARA
ncbi:MAG: cation:proton antiporter [Paracoccaceae bacterium]